MRALFSDVYYFFEYVKTGSKHYWCLVAYDKMPNKFMYFGRIPLNEDLTIADAIIIYYNINKRWWNNANQVCD